MNPPRSFPNSGGMVVDHIGDVSAKLALGGSCDMLLHFKDGENLFDVAEICLVILFGESHLFDGLKHFFKVREVLAVIVELILGLF